ncbi:MAG: ribosome silencing factor [Chloroflexi bacterium]|nr:ribosome silencing factor [Chloroflexota bacterium]
MVALVGLEVARKAVDVAVDKQASDIVLLDLRGLAAFADYFVICHADSARQLDAIADELSEVIGRLGVSAHHREGGADSGWVLLDYGDVVVHLFDAPRRAYYQLERVWERAVPLIRVQ